MMQHPGVNNLRTDLVDVPLDALRTHAKMFTVEQVTSAELIYNSEWSDIEQSIKRKMALELAEYMIEKKLLLFTKINSDSGFNTRYIARGIAFDAAYITDLRKMMK